MYKLLIVDDEKIVIDSINFIIEKQFDGEVETASARSGREAVIVAEKFNPDIVFMDINMPGIDGIEAAREIKRTHPSVLFIILTAFDRFDFAQRAISLGVLDYLTKPVNRTVVADTVRRAMHLVDESRRTRFDTLELRERLDVFRPMLEGDLIYALIFSYEKQENLTPYLELFGLETGGGFVLTLEARGVDGFDAPRLRSLLKGSLDCLVGPLVANRIIAYVPRERMGDEYAQRATIVEEVSSLYTRIVDAFGNDWAIGIGSLVEEFQLASSSYKESLQALHLIEGGGLLHFRDIGVSSASGDAYARDLERHFRLRIAAGDAEGARIAFESLVDWIVERYPDISLAIEGKCAELAAVVAEAAEAGGAGENDWEDGLRVVGRLASMTDTTEKRHWAWNRIADLMAAIAEGKSDRFSPAVVKAREYIETNYAENLNLEGVAREARVSPFYFSKRFKEECGEGFQEYLTRLRIDAAKKLLDNPERSVKEISFDIGYQDPNYFSRLFKKETGLTPSEYRERYGHL